MKIGDKLYCVKEFGYTAYYTIRIGEICIIDFIYPYLHINGKNSYRLDSQFIIDEYELEEYFETIHKRRKRIIENI